MRSNGHLFIKPGISRAGSEAGVPVDFGRLPIQKKMVRHLQAVSSMSTRYNDGSHCEIPDDGVDAPIYLTDSNSLRDQLRGQTTEHADPPRFEDEGQSGG
jgi:hypothetical protein